MSIFRRLLVRNVVTLVLLAVSILLALTLITSQHIAEQQKSHSRILKRLLTMQTEFDGKLLAKNLKSGFDYDQLNIQEIGGASIYQFQNSRSSGTLSESIISGLGLTPEADKVASQTLNISIDYKINTASQFKLMDTIWYASLGIIIFVLTLLSISLRQLVRKLIKRSINNLSNLINDFTDNDHDTSSWKDMPEEFMPLVEALDTLHGSYENKLQEWRKSAEAYRSEASRDELTGLKNRVCFVEYFENKLKDIDNLDFGIMTLTRASELQNMNQNRGYQAGDQYIVDLSQVITRVANTYQGAEVYRLNGSDFATVLPNTTPKEAENYANNLQGRLTEFQKSIETDAVAYTGLVAYEAGRPLGELLALADTAISISQTKYSNAWHLQSDSSVLENASSKYGNQNWREVIDDVVANARCILFLQQIQPTNKTSKVYSEVLARFTNEEEQVLPTASFIAMAEKMDKIILVDKMIVEQTLKLVQEKNLHGQFFGVNITAKSAHDEQFAIWLERRLLRDPTLAAKLVFEVTEFGMQQNMNASKRFLDMIHRTGARVTVERFGMGMTSFKFFRDLKPDFIKMDGSYSRGIDEDKNNQYFLRVIIDLAHRLGVGVLSESVETQEEKHTLEQLFIDGTQGYFIGKPIEM